MIQHDRLFKELLTTYFLEFLDLFLPELAALIEPGSIQFLDKELLASLLPNPRQEADLVVRAQVRGQPVYFIIHLEHQGDYVGRANPVASALMARMRIPAGERPRVKLECLRLLVGLRLEPAQQRLISGFVDTYLPLNEAEGLQFARERERQVRAVPAAGLEELAEALLDFRSVGDLETWLAAR